ncbi:MAG: DEAD/DEAH box helicase, partial [Spongiibacteraceae bacterium]|nr:DEAD/DEAH box helicase [Spongiibacteraceae bacterium]
MTVQDLTLDQVSVLDLKGVGPRMADKLSGLGINTVQDLLFHLPLRYQDRTRITPIGALQTGNDAVIEGEVKTTEVVFGRRRSLVVRLQDHSGTITLRFFYFSASQKYQLNPGTQLRCFGEARHGASGLEIYHPEYQSLSGKPRPMEQALTPIYPSTEGLTQQAWRRLCQQALTMLHADTLIEYLPQSLLPTEKQITLEKAIHYLHKPPTDASQSQLRDGRHPYQQRLAFEELLAHNLSLLRTRNQTHQLNAPELIGDRNLIKNFLNQLGFSLTAAQQRVEAEIEANIASTTPMLRLVQGDVGSGKTVIATIAALHAVSSDYQVAIMAPTDILAEQHFANFSRWLEPLEIKLAWLTGKVKG